MKLNRKLPIAAASIASLLYTATPSNAQAQAPAAAQTNVKSTDCTVYVAVKRHGSIKNLELELNSAGQHSNPQLKAQRLPSYAMLGDFPVVVVTSDGSLDIKGVYFPGCTSGSLDCSNGKPVTANGKVVGYGPKSDIVLRLGEGFPKDKAGYLGNNGLDSQELTDLLGTKNYFVFNLNIVSKDKGEGLKLPVVVVPNSSALEQKINSLNETYQTETARLKAEMETYRVEMDKLRAPNQENKDAAKKLEQDYAKKLEEAQRDCAAKLSGLEKKYNDGLGTILREIGSERFLAFAGYQLGNLTNSLGQGLAADLRMQGFSFQGVFNSRNFFADLEAELSSGSGNVNQNGSSAGSMDLTRNIFKVNGQYAVFHFGNASGGISAAYVYDKITQRGYLVNSRYPNDPSKRNNFAGNGDVTQGMVGGFVSGSTDSSRVSVAGHYGKSNLRGKEFNLAASGLFEGTLATAVASVDMTRYDGSVGYSAGTEFDVNASVAFTKGYKGIRPAAMVRFRQNGDNHDASVALGLSKSFGKSAAGVKYTPQKR